jgi:hypothetical protein
MKLGIVGLATTVLVSGGLGLAGLGLAAGTAQAEPGGPHRWCPGQSMEWPTGPFNQVAWDMSVCHTWWTVGYGQGNVASNYGPTPPGVPSIWDGDDPPAPAPPQPCIIPFCLPGL